MPVVSRFFGISIRMYFDEHNPPHFYAIYGKHEAQVGIDPIVVRQGGMPSRAASMVIEWAALHERELLLNWQRLRNGQFPERIGPLD